MTCGMRHNRDMGIVAAGLIHQGQLHVDIKRVIEKFGPDTAHVSYSLGEDSTGESAIFFRIVLTDAAAKEENLTSVTSRIARLVFDEVRPLENWGLYPYFYYRSQSEWQNRYDPEWSI